MSDQKKRGDYVTIAVRRETHDLLRQMGHIGDSYATVLDSLVRNATKKVDSN